MVVCACVEGGHTLLAPSIATSLGPQTVFSIGLTSLQVANSGDRGAHWSAPCASPVKMDAWVAIEIKSLLGELQLRKRSSSLAVHQGMQGTSSKKQRFTALHISRKDEVA